MATQAITQAQVDLGLSNLRCEAIVSRLMRGEPLTDEIREAWGEALVERADALRRRIDETTDPIGRG